MTKKELNKTSKVTLTEREKMMIAVACSLRAEAASENGEDENAAAWKALGEKMCPDYVAPEVAQ